MFLSFIDYIMTKFKVWDLVECIKDCNGDVEPWTRWKIVSLLNDGCYVNFPSERHYAMFYRELLLLWWTTKKIKHTYEKTYTRNDGVVFTKKTIEEPWYDKLEIKEIEKLIKNFADKSTKLKWLLNSHKNLKF